MSNENEKSYLKQISGELPADRKKRFNRAPISTTLQGKAKAVG